MLRIDAHIHFWKTQCGFDNRPIADNAAYRRDFMPQDVDADLIANDIAAVLLVQTCPQVEETAWILDLAEADPRVAGVTGWIDLEDEGCDLAPLLARRKLVGIRAQLRRIDDASFVARPTVLRNLERAMTAGLNLTMLAEARHYRHVLHALDVLPASPITLNHLGMRFADVDRAQWLAAMRRFGRHSHVTLQLSGLPFLFGTRWRDPEATQVMDDALDIFGPQRLMFASDWPMMLRFATYGEWVRAAADFLVRRGLSEQEQAAIFSGNVIRANPRLAAAAPHLIRRPGAVPSVL